MIYAYRLFDCNHVRKADGRMEIEMKDINKINRGE